MSRPVGFEPIWNESGSGAVTRLSMWRPIAPEGYVAMGTVCSNDHNRPSFNAVRCIREDLVIGAQIGEQIWSDKGSGAKQNCSAWKIAPPVAVAGEIYFGAGTFVGVQSFSEPAKHFLAYALRLPIAVDISSPPDTPTLTGHLPPLNAGAEKITQVARLPWFAVRDHLQPDEQFRRSPFYQLRRIDQYVLVGHHRNESAKSKAVKWISYPTQNNQSRQLFTKLSAIEIAKPWPKIALSDVRAIPFSACLPAQFIHAELPSRAWNEPNPQTVIAMAAKGKSVAVYQMESHYELLREDGDQVVAGFGYSDDNSLYMTEYPSDQDETVNACPLVVAAEAAEVQTSDASVDVIDIVELALGAPVATDTAP